MNTRSFLLKVVALLSALFFTVAYPETGCFLADKLAIGFSIKWLYIHHLVQLLLALVTILIINVAIGNKFSWGLNANQWRRSLKIALLFAAGWFVVTLAVNLLIDTPQQIDYEPTSKNILEDLFFDLVITGVSEEILFRGLVMGVLLHAFKGILRVGALRVSVAGVISALFFSLAHIGIDPRSFTVDHFSPLQMSFAFGLGIFYAVMRDKTGSLLGPVVAHGASDGIITIVQLFRLFC